MQLPFVLRYAPALFVIIAAFSVFAVPQETLSQSSAPLTGYAWSETAGWVSFNCSDLGTCGTSSYGLSIAADGTISGYAWSENLGWISANAADLSGCPTAPCTARMNDLAMQGWMKALSANDAQSGGWDGFISLSGSNYGPTLSSGVLSGYVWGDTVVGWLSFAAGSAPVSTTWLPVCASAYSCTDSTHRQNACAGAPIESCTAGLICATGVCVLPVEPSTPPGDELKVSPQLVGYGGTVTVSWNVSDATECSVTENNPSFVDSWTGPSGSHTSAPITDETTYTLSCTGTGGTLTQTATVRRAPNWREL